MALDRVSKFDNDHGVTNRRQLNHSISLARVGGRYRNGP